MFVQNHLSSHITHLSHKGWLREIRWLIDSLIESIIGHENFKISAWIMCNTMYENPHSDIITLLKSN